MTGRINPAIVSLLVGRQPKERLRFIDARYPTAQVHILALPNKSPEFSMSDMTVVSTKKTRVLLAVSVDSV